MSSSNGILHILAIEDNPGDICLIREAMEVEGKVVVDVASNSTLGAQRIQDGLDCDLVLMDINIPGNSGLDLVSQIRANDRDVRIPIVMFTSSNLVEDVREAERRGADMFVVKPFDVHEYIKVLREIRSRFLEAKKA